MAGPKGSKYYDIFLEYSIFLNHRNEGCPVLTQEHFELLLAVERLESISAAAKEMGISYRKAWELLRRAEQQLGFPLVQKIRGGREGGYSMLTQDGKRLADSYSQLRTEFNDSIKRVVKNFFHTINS